MSEIDKLLDRLLNMEVEIRVLKRENSEIRELLNKGISNIDENSKILLVSRVLESTLKSPEINSLSERIKNIEIFILNLLDALDREGFIPSQFERDTLQNPSTQN